MADLTESGLEVNITDDSTGLKVPVESQAGKNSLYVSSAIRDGAGSGSLVKVDKYNQLYHTFHPNNSLLDAIGRFRTAEPDPIFDSRLIRAQEEPLFFTSSLTGGGTQSFLANNSAVQVSVTTASGDVSIRQTKEYFRSRTGRSNISFINFVPVVPKANLTQRYGWMDDQNGLFFEISGTTKRFIRRTFVSGAAVDNAIAQASWSIDPLDGTGPSGLTLVDSVLQTLWIAFQWPGSAMIGFVINGIMVPCHELQWANVVSSTTVFMTMPDLPIRWELRNTAATASSSTALAIGCSVFCEGTRGDNGLIFSASNRSVSKSATSATRVPFIAIRPRSGFIRVPIRLLSYDTVTGGTQQYLLEVWHLRAGGNWTLTGSAWNTVNAQSAAEFDVAATAFTPSTDAICIDSNFISGANKQDVAASVSRYWKLFANFAGTADIFLITCMGVGGNALTVSCSMTWLEEI